MKLLSLLLISLVVVSPFSYAVTTTVNLEYDPSGNLIKDQFYFYEYDDFGQLVRVRQGTALGPTLSEYMYDYEGQRVMKIDYTQGCPVKTFYIGNFVQVEECDGTTHNTTYYRDEVGVIASEDEEGVTFYYPDHLGNPVISEKNGVVKRSEFLPFGTQLSGPKDRYGFTSQEYDPESELQYFNARYYSPSLMRFTQPDTVIADVYDPQSLNRYAYARNNPVRYVDPSGNTPWDVIDVGFFTLDAKNLLDSPSWSNVGWAALSGVSLLPLLPNFLGYFRYGDELLDVARGANNAGKVPKAIDRGEKLGRIAEKAITNAEGLRHGYDRHAAELGLDFTGKAWRKEGKAWTDLNKNIIANPEKTFKYTLNGKKVTGYYKRIDGKDIATFVYNEGRYKDGIASTWKLSDTQIKRWGLGR